MDKQTQTYFEKLDRVFAPRIAAINDYKFAEVAEVFVLAYKSIVHFYFLMSQDEGGKEVLHNMFGRASDAQLDKAHRLLVFWFLWQRDWARGLNFLESTKVRDGLKNIWSFSESEINNLKQEFDLEETPGMETYRLWQKLQNILENDNWSPAFVFPALSTSLKIHWEQLDLSVGDSI